MGCNTQRRKGKVETRNVKAFGQECPTLRKVREGWATPSIAEPAVSVCDE